MLRDPAGAAASGWDGLGNEHTFTMDRFGNATSHVNPLGDIVTIERNADGLPVEITQEDPDEDGPLGELTTTFTYGDNGNLTEMVLPDASELHWEYDETFNFVTQYTDELDRITVYLLDEENGNVLSERRVVGEVDDEINEEDDDVVTSFTYTAAPESGDDVPGGMLLTTTDALGRVEEREYYDSESDAFGLLMSVTVAAGTADEAVWHYEHNTARMVTEIEDSVGVNWVFEFDDLDRLVQRNMPVSGPVQAYLYEYDGVDNLVRETNPLGAETEYRYDALDRLVEVVEADIDGGGEDYSSPITVYAWDGASQLASVTDPLGRKVGYTRDELGRVVEMALPDVGGESLPVFSYTYGALGWLLSETDSENNTTSYGYNERGWVTTVTGADADGDPETEDSPVWTYSFDAAGQLEEQTDPLSRVTVYQTGKAHCP